MSKPASEAWLYAALKEVNWQAQQLPTWAQPGWPRSSDQERRFEEQKKEAKELLKREGLMTARDLYNRLRVECGTLCGPVILELVFEGTVSLAPPEEE